MRLGNRFFLMFILLLMALACTKPSDPGPDPGTPPVTQKQYLITRVTTDNSFYPNMEIDYDSLDRVTQCKVTALGLHTVHYQNGRVHHVLGPVISFNGLFGRKAWVFLYRADGKLDKVLHKRLEGVAPAEVADNSAWLVGESRQTAEFIDSLVYTATGQVAEIWSIQAQYLNSAEVAQYTYNSPGDSLPSMIRDYDGLYGELKDMRLAQEIRMVYGVGQQPAAAQLGFLAFCRLAVITMPQPPAHRSYRFWVLSFKPVTSFTLTDFTTTPASVFNSRNYTYQYAADSLSYSGTYKPDDIVYTRFTYFLMKK